MNSNRGINRNEERLRTRPRLYAVASGKGGVGKSIIAYNLANQLACDKKVLLIDGDFPMGNLHVLANVAPDHGWQAVCGGRVSLAEAVVSINGRLDLLASTGGRAGELLPDINDLASSLARIRETTENYDRIIIDTASGVLPHSNLIMNAVDRVILVTTPELTSISDCYALYKILVANNRHLVASLLVNRESREDEADYIYQKFVAISDQFLGCSPDFLGRLDEDPAVVESVARQRALIDFASDSPVTARFEKLAGILSGPVREPEKNPQTINITPVGADIKE